MTSSSNRSPHACAWTENPAAGSRPGRGVETTWKPGKRLAGDADLCGLGTLLALRSLVLDLLPFAEGPVAGPLNAGIMHEQIPTAIVGCDKAVTFLCIKPFDRTGCHRLLPCPFPLYYPWLPPGRDYVHPHSPAPSGSPARNNRRRKAKSFPLRGPGLIHKVLMVNRSI